MSKPLRTQVNKDHYFNLKYDKKERWISYWYQISEVINKKPKTVLEIGVGNKTVSTYLKNLKYTVSTCDFDKSLKPDIIANVLNLPLPNSSFDLILCAEVLEHIPFKNFQKGLREIYRVTKKYAIITLPHFSITNLYFGLKLIPFIPKKELAVKIDLPLKHQFTGEHYWEIGKKNFTLKVIVKSFEKAGFKIEKSYYPKENPHHHIFILKK